MATETSTATTTSREQFNGGAETAHIRGQQSKQDPVSASLDVAALFKAPPKSPEPYRHTYAVHAKSRTSCLSHDSATAPSFLGFRNLMALVLVVSNLRLMIVNFKKYGVLICLSCHAYRQQDILYGSILFFLVPCHLFVALLIEQIAARQTREALARIDRQRSTQAKKGQKAKDLNTITGTWQYIAFAHGINASINLVMASWIVYYYIHNPGIGTICEFHAIIVWLKTCSYAFTNRDLRTAALSNGGETVPELYKSVPYPDNISVSNLCYFWWAPTLVYQPVYPRTERIRWDFVAKRAAEAIALTVVIWLASAQYAVPLLRNSLGGMSNLDLTTILERLMKLSTISLFCWLAGFFALFQSFLNGLAEVLRFGDREFYSDWWNSSSLREYWTLWNKPVFQFMKRHIYSPMIGRGVPPIVAQITVFTFSGVLHELLVGVPTHNIIGVAFAGMMLQLPLIYITGPVSQLTSINGKLVGNLIFWISFCLVGQPLAAMMYFFAWQAKYGSVKGPQLWANK